MNQELEDQRSLTNDLRGQLQSMKYEERQLQEKIRLVEAKLTVQELRERVVEKNLVIGQLRSRMGELERKLACSGSIAAENQGQLL